MKEVLSKVYYKIVTCCLSNYQVCLKKIFFFLGDFLGLVWSKYLLVDVSFSCDES